jgi:hypothetical protein
MWYYGEGQFDKRVYRPGDRVYVGPNQSRAMNFTTGVWATEYARGPLPLSIPFGIADELVSTLDFATAAQTIAQYASLVGRHWRLPDPEGGAPSLLGSKVGSLLETAGKLATWFVRPPEPDDTIPSDNPRPTSSREEPTGPNLNGSDGGRSPRSGSRRARSRTDEA